MMKLSNLSRKPEEFQFQAFKESFVLVTTEQLRLVEQLENNGVVSEPGSNGVREVLAAA